MKFYGYSEYVSHKKKSWSFLTAVSFLKENSRNVWAVSLKGSHEVSAGTSQGEVYWVSGHSAREDGNLKSFLKQRSDMSHDAMSSH